MADKTTSPNIDNPKAANIQSTPHQQTIRSSQQFKTQKQRDCLRGRGYLNDTK
jgi:hypothetical protein